MKRWAWHIFCLFSLLVFVSSVTLWVRSYFVADTVGYVRGKAVSPGSTSGSDAQRYALGSTWGELWLWREGYHFDGEIHQAPG